MGVDVMTVQEILAKVASGDLSAEQAASLMPNNGNNGGQLSVKANPEKGSVSLYGLGRNPTTLYPGGWRRLFADGQAVVEAFLDEYSEYLPTSKGAATKKVPANLIGDGKPFRIPKIKE